MERECPVLFFLCTSNVLMLKVSKSDFDGKCMKIQIFVAIEVEQWTEH